jgi:D-alanyl-D-alanine-carboxypeptidase/D-alanyl-D-alanine-endopeptidase
LISFGQELLMGNLSLNTRTALALSVAIPLALISLVGPVCGQTASLEPLEAWVAPAIEQHWLVGGAVGLITPQGQELAGFGSWAHDDARVPNGDTLFEIGSISKVFTGLLLADAVVRGELTLETEVARLLPSGIDLDVLGRPITLLDLTTHSSGLPRMPSNIRPSDPFSPYVDYDVTMLLAFMDEVEPVRAPEVSYEYSNLAVGLLGWLVANNAGSDYETLLSERVFVPLGMTDTALSLDERLAPRLAQAHDSDGQPSSPWPMDVLAGAGGIRSSARDMLRFARFALGQLEPVGSDTLTDALALSMIPRREVTGDPRMRMGLGWHVNVDRDAWWHNGQTGGYHAMLTVLPEDGVAVVGLSNTAGGVIEQVVNGLVSESMDWGPMTITLPDFAALDAAALDRLAGRYGHRLLGVLVVRREELGLSAQLGPQQALRIWPESESRCAYRAVPAVLEFELSEEQTLASAVVLHQNGGEMNFERLGAEGDGEQ